MRRTALAAALALTAFAFVPAGPARGVQIDGTVAIAGFTFTPGVAGPASPTQGARVTFRNLDPVNHTASFPPGCVTGSTTRPCAWDTGTMLPGAVKLITLPAWLLPGPYVYYCQVHSGLTSQPPIPMRGVLVLGI